MWQGNKCNQWLAARDISQGAAVAGACTKTNLVANAGCSYLVSVWVCWFSEFPPLNEASLEEVAVHCLASLYIPLWFPLVCAVGLSSRAMRKHGCQPGFFLQSACPGASCVSLSGSSAANRPNSLSYPVWCGTLAGSEIVSGAPYKYSFWVI